MLGLLLVLIRSMGAATEILLGFDDLFVGVRRSLPLILCLISFLYRSPSGRIACRPVEIDATLGPGKLINCVIHLILNLNSFF